MRFTPMRRGTELLREKLAGHGKQAAFVAQFNKGNKGTRVDAPMVSRWVHGRMPSPEHMARIEDLLHIPMRAWTEEVKRAKGAA